jgi:hypothetical protein
MLKPRRNAESLDGHFYVVLFCHAFWFKHNRCDNQNKQKKAYAKSVKINKNQKITKK